MHRSATGRKAAPVLATALVVPALLLGACGQEEAPESMEMERVPEQVERLRSIPYLGGTPAPRDEVTGVVSLDPDRACPGYRLYTVQLLG